MSWDRIETSAAGFRAATCARTPRTLLALTTAIALAAIATPAHATTMWPDQLPEEQPAPTPPAAAPRVRKLVRPAQPHAVVAGQKLARRGAKPRARTANGPQEGAKPHGPLVIAVSIARQHVRIYDADGLFAESPVSTGMRGHPTPMGVFSIIQKSKYHRSNIYSGAPMPYMQRITWSGVAMHAGVLPGYPASHGCIRLPMAFAVKLWGWSRLGARVIVAPDDVAPPASIAHPLLMTRASQPAEASAAPAVSDSSAAPAKDAGMLADHVPLRRSIAGHVRLADADSGLPSTPANVDAMTGDGSRRADSAAVDHQPASSPAAPEPAAHAAAVASGDPTAREATTTASVENSAAAAPPSPAGPGKPPADGPHPGDLSSSPRPADNTTIASRKDAAPAEAASAASRRNGHVAVLISRKAGRLYVRQNFEPWFDVPIVIAQGDRPLGTHVFTAVADATDPGSLRWSVVSLPQMPRRREADDESRHRPRRAATVVETESASLPAPADVLSRLTIPADATSRIAAALAPGGSIVVSDQGPGDETGLGTDFIIPLR